MSAGTEDFVDSLEEQFESDIIHYQRLLLKSLSERA